MKNMNYKQVAACDMDSIVVIGTNEAGETTITPMGMYSLAEQAWYAPSVAVAKTFDQMDGSEEDCEPIIIDAMTLLQDEDEQESTLTFVDVVAKILTELNVQKVDEVNESTEPGTYAVAFLPRLY